MQDGPEHAREAPEGRVPSKSDFAPGQRAAFPGVNSPALHHFYGPGIELHFQDGPILQFGVNGCTNEEIIELLVARIGSLQGMHNGAFACIENARAIDALEEARAWLDARTARRMRRGVEGSNQP